MGSFWGFWIIDIWGSREGLGLMGEQGSELKYPQHPESWNTVNKDLFLPVLIVGPYTKAPCQWAAVCLVTIVVNEFPNLSFSVCI